MIQENPSNSLETSNAWEGVLQEEMPNKDEETTIYLRLGVSHDSYKEHYGDSTKS